jgi:hypothetical protein
MTVRHFPDMSKGHKFECETEVTCAKTAKNTVSLVVNVGKDIVVPLKRAFLDIICEENCACDCPTKLEDWWQKSAERNFVSHC